MGREMLLKGEFVCLRPLVALDAERTFNWRQSKRAALLNSGARSVVEQSLWISSRPNTEYNFVIMLNNGLPVGMLSLLGVNMQNQHAETGRFLIGDQEAVVGVPAAVEAMLLLYRFAFETLNLRRVFGTIANDNQLMIKWQVYFGMRREGVLRQHYFIDGKFQDAVCLGLLEDDYREVSLPRMTALIAASRRSLSMNT
jgi:diamine N-acetyltransferase